MITTYSVIIQNQKTMDAFLKFQPLFLEALNNDRIGVCKWIESGTTLESAVPELKDLTNDKEEWRAIIVRFEDGELLSEFESDARNPYDFIDSASDTDEIKESKNPLIRLTQMLGGVPAPEIKFEEEVIIEVGKAPRTIYKPIVDLEANQRHKELCEKYEFDGRLPSSVVILSIRQKNQTEKTIDSAWVNNSEVNSSNFWKRNKYPSNCRFLVYDFMKQGPVQRDADEFGFWMSLMLLSTNDIDSSTLQAYRLYTLKSIFDKSKMEDVFNTTVSRLLSLKKGVEQDIKKDIELKLAISDTLPEYSLEVPVVIEKYGQDLTKEVKPASFGFFSEGANNEVARWEAESSVIEENFEACVRSAERTLDKTADKMKPLCVFTEDEVSNLDKYQIEDLTRETGELYNEVVKIQGILPKRRISKSSSVAETKKKVKDFIIGRMRIKSALGVLGIVLVLLLLSSIPGIVRYATETKGSIPYVFAILGIVFGIVVVVAAIVILIQKCKLNKLIKAYNEQMGMLFGNIISSAGNYSAYLSNIASHSRGLSYLDLSKRKRDKIDNYRFVKYAYVRKMNILLAQIENWSKAYFLKIDFDNPAIGNSFNVDMSENSYIYTFEYGKMYPVALNNSGVDIEAPFSFIKKLEITREELYDDGKI